MMTDEEFELLAAADAVGALTDDERALLERETASDPRRADQLRDARLAASAFAETVPEIEPPARIRQNLLDLIETPRAPEPGPVEATEDEASPAVAAQTEPGQPDIAQPAPARVARPRRRWYALAAAVAGVAVLGSGAFLLASQLTRPAAVVALDEIEGAEDAASAQATLPTGGEVTLHWSVDLGQAVMTAEDLPDIDDDRDYEMWFVREDGPVSAGVFGESDDPIAIIEAEMHEGDVFAVTVEQTGGSSTGLPTTDPFVVIETS